MNKIRFWLAEHLIILVINIIPKHEDGIRFIKAVERWGNAKSQLNG